MAMLTVIYAPLFMLSPFLDLPAVISGVGYVLACGLLGMLVLTEGLYLRPTKREVGWMVVIVVMFLLLGVRLSLPERTHLIEYGLLAVLADRACDEHFQSAYPRVLTRWLALGVTAMLGVLDESIQVLLPQRVFDVRDILFNVGAAAGTLGIISLLRWVRHKRRTGSW